MFHEHLLYVRNISRLQESFYSKFKFNHTNSNDFLFGVIHAILLFTALYNASSTYRIRICLPRWLKYPFTTIFILYIFTLRKIRTKKQSTTPLVRTRTCTYNTSVDRYKKEFHSSNWNNIGKCISFLFERRKFFPIFPSVLFVLLRLLLFLVFFHSHSIRMYLVIWCESFSFTWLNIKRN